MDLSNTSHTIGQWVYRLFTDWGISPQWSAFLYTVVTLALLIIVVYLSLFLIKWILRFIFTKAAGITKTPFLRYLVNNRFPYYLALTIPYNIVKHSIPVVFTYYPTLINPLSRLVDIYLVLMVVWLVMSVIKSAIDLLREKPAFRHKPLASYQQVIQGVVYLFGLVVIFSIVTGKSPTAFFAAMGAASAVLMLVFKDSIMGLVASIQMTTNDMVRIDDWITVPKYGADGDVIEINLTTVKVRNFDKTITTLPTYALISDSFQNWRGMQASGGRRIKRAIIIKQSSIRYIADDELDRFRRIQGIRDYIDEKQAEIATHNEKIGADRSIPVNGRNQTNAGLFRKYIDWYLRNHPGVNKNMTLMVRHLAPTDSGLPFELYVFTNTINWIKYEEIMSDIFDHLIAAVQYFDLQIFEKEAGGDVKNIQMQQ